jgi:hypothetical protein
MYSNEELEEAEQILRDNLEKSGSRCDFISTAELAEFCGISKKKSNFFTRIVRDIGGVHARQYNTKGPSGFRKVIFKKVPSSECRNDAFSDFSMKETPPKVLESLQALCKLISSQSDVGENSEECVEMLHSYMVKLKSLKDLCDSMLHRHFVGKDADECMETIQSFLCKHFPARSHGSSLDTSELDAAKWMMKGHKSP